MDHFERVQAAVEWAEERLGDEIRVADLARRACYSPYHFHRIFYALTGDTVMDYVRKRRMTEAARMLLAGERIIDVAFASAYDSQEAFTRAFKDHHGLTPGRYRKRGRVTGTRMKRPLTREDLSRMSGEPTIEPGKFVDLPAFSVIGMCGWFHPESSQKEIPKLWGRFVPRMGAIEGVANPDRCYGICFGADAESEGDFFYMPAMGVESIGDLPPDMVAKTIPAARYAVFTAEGGISGLIPLVHYIWKTWLPASDYRPAPSPDFELYDERFDAEKDTGEIDVYVPILDPAE